LFWKLLALRDCDGGRQLFQVSKMAPPAKKDAAPAKDAKKEEKPKGKK
jgi:hypothetical protein